MGALTVHVPSTPLVLLLSLEKGREQEVGMVGIPGKMKEGKRKDVYFLLLQTGWQVMYNIARDLTLGLAKITLSWYKIKVMPLGYARGSRTSAELDAAPVCGDVETKRNPPAVLLLLSFIPRTPLIYRKATTPYTVFVSHYLLATSHVLFTILFFPFTIFSVLFFTHRKYIYLG